MPGEFAASVLGTRFAFFPRTMTDTQLHAVSPTTRVKSRLLHGHHALQELSTRLNCALECDDSADIRDVWTQFERIVRDQIDTEERFIFPLVSSAHRSEVEELRLQHEHILCALGELGTLADLHALRKASVDELIQYLLEHSSREELYEWLGDHALIRGGSMAMFARRAKQSVSVTTDV